MNRSNVAFSISTRDRVELTRQTLPPLLDSGCDIFWVDGSVTEKGAALAQEYPVKEVHTICGGSDIAIIFALTLMLEHPNNYDFIGLLENDVLLGQGWLPRLLDLFKTPGIRVGAVSSRNIKNRILFSLGDRTIMACLGGGHILFSRAAAKIILRNHRTWPTRDIRHVFLTMAGVDVGAPGKTLFDLGGGKVDDMLTYGSADFAWDPILALHGYATLAPVPTMARNIDYKSVVYAEEPTPVNSKWGVYAENLYKCGVFPPASLAAILTVTSNIWLVMVQHFPSEMFSDGWTCRHECLRGFAGHVYTSTKAGDSLTIDYVGTECYLFICGLDNARVQVDLDNDSNAIVDLSLNMKRISAIKPYGVHRIRLIAFGPGVEVFGASFTEKQVWFEPSKLFDFYSLPPISDSLHRNEQIQNALDSGADISMDFQL